MLTLYFEVVYNLCTWITFIRDRNHPASISIICFGWEKFIPFVRAMIVPYMSLDLFFVAAPFVCSDASEIRAYARRMLLAITLAGLCFLIVPLKMGPGFVHPPVQGFYGFLFAVLGGFDKQYNLAPSLHIALRSILWIVYIRHLGQWGRPPLRFWFILIGLSTLLTWQHHVIDLITGQALAMLCFYVFPDFEAHKRPRRFVFRKELAHRDNLWHARGDGLSCRLGVSALGNLALVDGPFARHCCGSPCAFRTTYLPQKQWAVAP